MTEQRDTRDQIADLRRRALRSLSGYTGGFSDLERVNRSLKEIVFTLDDLIDSPWTQTLITLWSRLEMNRSGFDAASFCEKDAEYDEALPGRAA